MIFERCYVARLEDVFFDLVEKRIPKMVSMFVEWFNNEVQDEEVDENQNLFGSKKKNDDS